MTVEQDVHLYCVDCGRPATTERLDGMVLDNECVELVCAEHAAA